MAKNYQAYPVPLANSADDKLMVFYFFFFFQKTKFEISCKLSPMQIVSIGDNLHEMSNSVSGKK